MQMIEGLDLFIFLQF